MRQGVGRSIESTKLRENLNSPTTTHLYLVINKGLLTAGSERARWTASRSLLTPFESHTKKRRASARMHSTVDGSKRSKELRVRGPRCRVASCVTSQKQPCNLLTPLECRQNSLISQGLPPGHSIPGAKVCVCVYYCSTCDRPPIRYMPVAKATGYEIRYQIKKKVHSAAVRRRWGAGAGALRRLPVSRDRAGVSACSRLRHGESGRREPGTERAVNAWARPFWAAAACAARNRGQIRSALTGCHRACPVA